MSIVVIAALKRLKVVTTDGQTIYGATSRYTLSRSYDSRADFETGVLTCERTFRDQHVLVAHVSKDRGFSRDPITYGEHNFATGQLEQRSVEPYWTVHRAWQGVTTDDAEKNIVGTLRLGPNGTWLFQPKAA